MAQIQLTRGQSETIKRHIQEAQLKALISYRSGRLEAEFIDPGTSMRERIDLTPYTPPQVPQAHRWTAILIFGGILWAVVWFVAGMMGFLAVPPIIIGVNIAVGLVASVAGIVLAERQLGTPILLSPQQSKVLQNQLEEGAVLDTVSGGGGTSVIGRGQLFVQLMKEEGTIRYVIGPSGDVKGRATPATRSQSGG